ncbi:MAG: DUF308 domain-containing protein [Nocardiopsaceae bacterium]|nr:DUF308 domain-containing protein [Nocardiopsaceae bacterium]
MPGFPLSWRAAFVLGLITLVLGAILVFQPTHSLNVISVLLGAAMIASGVYHLLRTFDSQEGERVWQAVSGVLFILVGQALVRDFHLGMVLIGLFIGFTWIIQGVSALMESFSGHRARAETGWSLFFGVISLIAGIVVVIAPIASVTTLAIFMGAWFVVMGLVEMVGSLVTRRAAGRPSAGPVSVPGQRSSEAPAAGAASGEASSGESVSSEAASGDSASGEAMSGESASRVAGSGKTRGQGS